ncbi:MAG: MurR/RpiR family transcriptional regulator [Rhodospirillaceae bacterium]|nr:MurR/RpiR family transcriptional regulator [Rhodospirillaceae bacterium]
MVKRTSKSKKEITAPRTIEQLRNLVLSIARDEAGVSLGAKAHNVLARLVDMPEQSAVRSISELAQALDINASTLTRLAKRLGFNGFSDFQNVFRDAIADDKSYFYSRQAGRLLADGDIAQEQEEIGVFNQIARDTETNVKGFISQLEKEELHKAAHLLANAGRVRIHGVRQFHALASFFTYGLGLLRSDVALLNAPQLGIAEAISQLERGDVVVVSSCAPYTQSIADVAEVAARHGIEVIAITDTRSSPLAVFAKYSFFVPHAGSFFSNSMGAYIVFCEGLLSIVARELGDKALQTLSNRERMIADMNIES